MNIKIALAGNPNSGKTTLFNSLTGSNQFVGNWPGVTVEKKEGTLKKRDDVTIIDLPGIYSLSPYSLEEIIARNFLIDDHPDAIINIVDGTNIERNLYLTTQLMEIGIPVVVAVNMCDIIRKKGDTIDILKLSQLIGCDVIEISALKKIGINEAVENAADVSREKKISLPRIFSKPVENALTQIETTALQEIPECSKRWFAIKIFERDKEVLEKLNLPQEISDRIEEEIKKVEKEYDEDAESVITSERYLFISSLAEKCIKKKNTGTLSVSDKIDKVATNRLLGLPIFALIIFFIYWTSMSGIGSAATDWANEGLFGEGWFLFGVESGSHSIWIPGIPVLFGNLLDTLKVSETGIGAAVRGLLLNGIIAGVGSVLGFVPQIFILFIMLALLESCGYMARVAFVLDRIFRKFGLSGKSFIPMLVASGCGVPGIMASRTIENERDRRMTIITATFIPCSAKIPFILLIAAALFNGNALIATSAYFIGMLSVIISGIILKKTIFFSGKPAPFVMELPQYRMPGARNVIRSASLRCWGFIEKAGTIILLSTVFVWFTSYFGFNGGTFHMLTEEELGRSLLASTGKIIAPIFAPLGWGNWQAAVASMTGLVAKENIVGTLGILYGAENEALEAALANVFTVISGLSFLIFNLLCAPCFAAMGAIRREMNSMKGTIGAITYQCLFAYSAALIVCQFGTFIVNRGFKDSNIAAFTAAAAAAVYILYMLFRPDYRGRNISANFKITKWGESK